MNGQERWARRVAWVVSGFVALLLALAVFDIWLRIESGPSDQVAELLELCEQDREVGWSISFEDLGVTIACPSGEITPVP